MRLLCYEDNGRFSLVEYFNKDIPPYAILSHTWGGENEEVSFKDLADGAGREKPGYEKIHFCAKQAANDGLRYFWVDTCCIDKSSSAELSEAINSMFRWYHDADKCYVYLSDVSINGSVENDESPRRWEPSFKKSRWFSRGWTLQELIAPTSVEFFSREGKWIGDKKSLAPEIQKITGINIRALLGSPLSQLTVNERMSWATKRETKREEDAAYSLLGIFDIYMPLIYGEGRNKAFLRLQKEIKESINNEFPPIPSTPSTQHGGDPNPLDTKGLCLLSLDGGGMRGLSTLYILKSIMDRLNTERDKEGLSRVKPCEVFDLIGGTNTGGLIAIMLGRLEMSVDECITSYSELAAAVFGEEAVSHILDIEGGAKPRFELATLESALKKMIKESGTASETDLLNDGTERGCHTFVCTIDRFTKRIIRLRSYSLPGELSIRPTICEAALATSATTNFFDPVSIGNRSFADGGYGANNPVEEVEGEAANKWCPETGDLKPLVKCFISIGTGNLGMDAFEDSMLGFLRKTVVQIATETEATEKKFIARWAKHFDEKRYFRFNVEQGLQNIGLEEYKKRGFIEAASEDYLMHMAQKFRVRDCIQNLRLKQSVYIGIEDFA